MNRREMVTGAVALGVAGAVGLVVGTSTAVDEITRLRKKTGVRDVAMKTIDYDYDANDQEMVATVTYLDGEKRIYRGLDSIRLIGWQMQKQMGHFA